MELRQGLNNNYPATEGAFAYYLGICFQIDNQPI